MDIPACCGGCQHRDSKGNACGAPLDSKGNHARTCPIGGWTVRKHDACCGVLKNWLEEQGCHVEAEPVLPTAAEDRPESRTDWVAHSPALDGVAHIGLTVVSAVSREALSKGSADREGVAASVAEARKRTKYPLIAVLPFAIEDNGRLGDAALSFVRKIAPRDLRRRAEELNALYQALGATLQRTATKAILAAIGTPLQT